MTTPEASVVVGVSCDFHDAAAAVVVDGAVVAAAEQERFSRCKHDPATPVQAIEACLRVAELHPDQVDVVAFYERPIDVVARFLASRQRQGPAGFASFVRDAPQLVGRNLMVAYRLDRALRRLGATRSPEFLYTDHHMSHAASAFFASPHRRAAVLTVDGIGEWATATVARGAGNHIEVVEELRYPDSLGLVYSFVTAYCGFTPNSDEYKLMGLAPFGTPRFGDELAELVRVFGDGSVEVRAPRLGWYGPRGLRSRRLRQLFDGPPRDPDGPLTQRDADLAASVQVLVEDAMVRLSRHARDVTGEDALCLAGGVALNCVANARIRTSDPSRPLWVQPAAGDAGGALGAALSVWHEVLGHPRDVDEEHDAMNGAFLGPSLTPGEAASWATLRAVDHVRVGDHVELCDLVAARLEAGEVVGWFQGRMEYGPRALGHRSILADPRRSDMRSHINHKVKGRESFRPFAPSVLEGHRDEWFDLDVHSPFMLTVAHVRGALPPPVDPEAGSDFAGRADRVQSPLPACTHVDGTARVQTVDAGTNPEFSTLIEAFHRRTGCPVVLNTSFNVAGEPIVATPEDALRTARRASLDLLVVDDVLIELRSGVGEHR